MQSHVCPAKKRPLLGDLQHECTAELQRQPAHSQPNVAAAVSNIQGRQQAKTAPQHQLQVRTESVR